MAKVIAVTNRKGGVGKSTVVTHTAAGLAQKGYRVGLVDTDSQGNASMMLGIEPKNSLYDWLINKAPLEDVAHYVPRENYTTEHSTIGGHLALISSAGETYKIPNSLEQDETFLFFESLEHFANEDNLDYIFIDTNPSVSLFDASIYLAVDAFIYVTECESMSLAGVQSAVAQMRNFRTQRQRYFNRDTRVLGIVPNKFRSRTRLHQKNLRALHGAFGGLVWQPMVLRTLWPESGNLNQPIFLYDPESKAAADAWQLVNRTEQELQQWEVTVQS